MKALTARERLDTIDNFDDDDSLLDNHVDLLIVGACDRDGVAIFTTDNAGVIGGLLSVVTTRIIKAIQDTSGMTAEVQERLAKNSKEATADDSPSS